MNEQHGKDARIRELLAERALFELSAEEQKELRELLATSSIDQESFERAAAMAALALHPGPHESLPASLKARIADAAPAHIAAASKRRIGTRFECCFYTANCCRHNFRGAAGSPFPRITRLACRRRQFAHRAFDVVVRTSTPPIAPSLAEQRTELLQRAPDVVKFDWTPTVDQAATGATGDVVWSNQQQKGFMRFKGLAKNDPQTNQYQLWIFDAKQDDRYPIDGGVFDISPATGDVIVPIRAAIRVAEPQMFAVTVEKPGGVVVSSRGRIAVTAKPPG